MHLFPQFYYQSVNHFVIIKRVYVVKMHVEIAKLHGWRVIDMFPFLPSLSNTETTRLCLEKKRSFELMVIDLVHERPMTNQNKSRRGFQIQPRGPPAWRLSTHFRSKHELTRPASSFYKSTIVSPRHVIHCWFASSWKTVDSLIDFASFSSISPIHLKMMAAR